MGDFISLLLGRRQLKDYLQRQYFDQTQVTDALAAWFAAPFARSYLKDAGAEPAQLRRVARGGAGAPGGLPGAGALGRAGPAASRPGGRDFAQALPQGSCRWCPTAAAWSTPRSPSFLPSASRRFCASWRSPRPTEVLPYPAALRLRERRVNPCRWICRWAISSRCAKQHPCGGGRWRIIRVGADIKIRCLGCGRLVMMDRPTFEKRMKKSCSERPEGARNDREKGICSTHTTASTHRRRRKRRRRNPVMELLSWVVPIALAVVVALVVRTYVFEFVAAGGAPACSRGWRPGGALRQQAGLPAPRPQRRRGGDHRLPRL